MNGSFLTLLAPLAGQGVEWELALGHRVLPQPERSNADAQAVIRTLQADEDQHGYLMEARVLKTDLLNLVLKKGI